MSLSATNRRADGAAGQRSPARSGGAPRRLQALLLTLCLGSTACGGGVTDVALALTAAPDVAEDAARLQIAILDGESGRRCSDLIPTECLVDQSLPAAAFVAIDDGSAVVVDLTQSNPTTSVTVPAGVDYVVVVEAYTDDTPALLVGSSCTPRVTVEAGKDNRIPTNPMTSVGGPPFHPCSADPFL